MSIRELYIWVHPGSREVSHSQLDSWMSTILSIRSNSNAGMVETTTLDGKQYGSFIRKKMAPPKEYLRSVAYLESIAAELNKRYLLWPQGPTIDVKKASHLETLALHFGNGADKPLQFDSVTSFGVLSHQWFEEEKKKKKVCRGAPHARSIGTVIT